MKLTNYIYIEIPGTQFEVPGHEEGCHCPVGRCVGRPADVELPLRWMWWSTRKAGGFVLCWREEFGYITEERF